jgi:hypothetical protein
MEEDHKGQNFFFPGMKQNIGLRTKHSNDRDWERAFLWFFLSAAELVSR